MNGWKSKITILHMVIVMMMCGCSAKIDNPPSITKESRPSIRVGCLISEEYYFYARELDSAAVELASRKWLEGYKTTEGSTVEIWQKISKTNSKKELVFVEEAFFNFQEMNEEEKIQLMEREDIDLLLTFGTVGGAWLTKNSEQISYDYMMFGAADPITAGIVPDMTNRYSNHSFVHIDPKRSGRQIDMAFRLFPFQDIGVVYEDSAAAYSYSGIKQLEERGSQYGFQIHTLHVEEPKNEADYDRYYRELKSAYAKLIPQIDVLYITTGKIGDEKLPFLLEDVHKAGIVTVAQTSESQVEQGALVHITMSDPVEEGNFVGQIITEYLEGTPIDRLNQVYEISPKIVFNYDTARMLGVEIPMATYLIADTIYPKKTGAAGYEEFKE